MSEPPEEGLAEVRARLRAQFRAARRSEEEEAVRDQWRRRTLAEALAEAMRRGDTVRLRLPGLRVQGRVLDAGRDYVVVDAPRGQVVVRVAAAGDAPDPYHAPLLVAEVVERSRSGGTDATRPASTFRAALARLEVDSRLDARLVVEVGTSLGGEGVTGRLEALGADHVYVRTRDGVDVLVPLGAVTYACARRPPP
jgi:hypothetical protein